MRFALWPRTWPLFMYLLCTLKRKYVLLLMGKMFKYQVNLVDTQVFCILTDLFYKLLREGF